MIEEYKKATLDLDAPVLKWNNHAIMYKSEESAIKESVMEICERIKPTSVLEVGFGEGYTASIFRSFCDRHVVVEVHPQIAKKARDLGYNVVESSIQDYTDEDHYDLLYDDHYPFPGMPEPNYAKFDHDWRSFVFLDQRDTRPGFMFTVDGLEYFQHLERNG